MSKVSTMSNTDTAEPIVGPFSTHRHSVRLHRHPELPETLCGSVISVSPEGHQYDNTVAYRKPLYDSRTGYCLPLPIQSLKVDFPPSPTNLDIGQKPSSTDQAGHVSARDVQTYLTKEHITGFIDMSGATIEQTPCIGEFEVYQSLQSHREQVSEDGSSPQSFWHQVTSVSIGIAMCADLSSLRWPVKTDKEIRLWRPSQMR